MLDDDCGDDFFDGVLLGWLLFDNNNVAASIIIWLVITLIFLVAIYAAIHYL